jgi:regulator of protease activity HflC (stomatin/prohibitin superfamily)
MAFYPQSIDDLAPPPARRGWRRRLLRHLPGLSFVFLVGLLIVVVLWPYVVITVPSGSVGVLWKRFNGLDLYCWCWVGRGTVLDPRELREEGLHIIWPWDKLYLYNLRLQSTTQTYNAISKDGVNVKAQISVRYQLLHNSVAVLHKFIGPDFLTSVVDPEMGSQARQVIAQYTAEAVYTSREQIQKQIRDATQRSLAANLNKLVQPEAMEQPDPKHYNDFLQDAIQILDTLVLSIELPPDIVSAINRQTEQYYMIQEYKFRVQREAEESKRKQIEADGIAAFQKTVSQGISESYLRWRGIEATLLLSQSPNAKVVVIGSGRDGLPIILNAEPNAAGAPPQSGGSGASTGTPSSSGASGASSSGTSSSGTPSSGASSSGSPSGSPGNTPPPAPAGNTPPNTSTAPGASPGSPGSPGSTPNKPPPGTSGAASPPSPAQTANAAPPSATPESGTAAPTASALDLPGVRPLLSGISGALRAGAELISPETKSKQ